MSTINIPAAKFILCACLPKPSAQSRASRFHALACASDPLPMTSLLHTLHQWTGLPTPFSTSTNTSTSTSINTQPVGPERVGPLWQQLLDDDRLSDACWNAEMRTVEVWENERWAGVPPPTSPGVGGDTFDVPSNHNANTNTNATGTGGWSKANLKPGERGAWTRGRDGWSAVGVASGEVSNLTFALGPGWEFVPSEGWRRDARGGWSTCGADRDGWVYTNDAWMDARAAPAGRGTAPVTRRRRWVRRVWFRGENAPSAES